MTVQEELRFLRDKISQLQQNLSSMQAAGLVDAPALDATRNPGRTQYSIDSDWLAVYIAQLTVLLAAHPELQSQ